MSSKPRFVGEKVRVSDAFDLRMGKTPSRKNPAYWRDGGHDWVSIADLGSFGKYVGVTKERINDLAISESGIKPAPANTVLMSFKLSLGKTSITTEPVYTNEAIMAFVDKGVYPVDASFMYHQCRAKDWTPGTNTAVMGKTLNKKTLGQAYVHLPALELQKMIAARLDFIDEQIRASKSSADKLEHLVKSRFVEMFKGYVRGGNTVALSELCEFVTVGIANAATHAYADDGIVMLRNLNVRENYLDDSDLIKINPDFAAKYSKKTLKAGDILVTRTGYPGIACVVPEKYAGCQTFTTLIARLKSDAQIIPLFLSFWINSPVGKEFVERMKAGSSQQNFGATSLKLLEVPLPPLSLQQEFAAFVSQVDKSRFVRDHEINFRWERFTLSWSTIA